MTIDVDLSSQEYEVFDIIKKPSFVNLQSKNFIFGKNGMGKSTLCKIVKNQFESYYDVKVFTGLNNILEDNKLNALVLGEDNVKAASELKQVDSELSILETNKEKLRTKLKSLGEKKDFEDEKVVKHDLCIAREAEESKLQNQRKDMDFFLQSKAKQLKEFNSPRITKITYYKNDFLKDISNFKIIEEVEEQKCKNILNEKPKSIIPDYEVIDIDFVGIIDNVNEILQYKIKEVITVKEIDDDLVKKEFALKGLKIHKAGENCSFCGNKIEEERLTNLELLISSTEIKENEKRIKDEYEKIEKLIKLMEKTRLLNKGDFYSHFSSEVDNINKNLEIKKEEYKNLLLTLKDKLNEKSRNAFSTVSEINIKIPDNFLHLNEGIQELIIQSNKLTGNLTNEQNLAKEKLRLHYVGLKLREKEEYRKGWRGYEIEDYELTSTKENIKKITNEIKNKKLAIKGLETEPEKNTLNYLLVEIRKLEIVKLEILKHTRSTYKLVRIINDKLKRSGKLNLELTLREDENKIEHYQVKDGETIRSIDKLSTGEKNIIGFLYFIESLNNLERKSHKNKIIIFDDPMNSNDDTMQYLMITEIQKLYRNQYLDKFNSKKDYFVCLTHNAHFYLNVQPYGNHRKQKLVGDNELKTVSKYNENNYYRIEDRNFVRITSEKEDFNTHYEFLWIELKSLYNNNLLNSMLNSMRRIIETYTKFNKIHLDKFYKNNEQHRKLFDVNSHSIDDHSMETLGKVKEELIEILEQIFKSNHAENHFNTYWKKPNNS
ncbi:AAA family ATPase [Metaplanococcus flavidus]|uniref:AAA family ATPase n=1 Tax=Metaplanococcus flavidus TaxID=569883 RepID=A0ABW3LAA9_9BACL